MLAIGLGLLAVLVVVYVRLSFRLFYATYASTRATELEALASLQMHEQEHVALIRDLKAELTEVGMTAEQKAMHHEVIWLLIRDIKAESTQVGMTAEQKTMHHEVIGLLEARLAKIRIAIQQRLYWRQRHLKYMLTRGVWIYVTEVFRSYFSK